MTESPYVFIALLTTGASPQEDRIVEAAAVRPAESGTEEFAGLADPGQLNPAVMELTGLRPQDTSGKPAPAEVARDLIKFASGLPVVAWDVEAVAAFLQAAGVRPPSMLDARHLARISLPTAGDYSLTGIASVLELEVHGRRALNDAWLLARIWSRLLEALGRIPPPAHDAICRLAEAAGDPLAPALAAAVSGGMELTSDPEQELAGLFESHSELLRRAQSADKPDQTEEPLRTDAICRMFYPGGRIGGALTQFEHRAEQVEMVGAVCDALNEGRHLMVEAATGTGKSLAYLVPAIGWTCTNADKVIVSTNTRNLQEQLFRKDLPFLQELLPGRFEPALLKGRANYLCVRRFLHLLRHFERELAGPEEYMALAPLIAWAGQTESGDLAECNGFLLSPQAPSVVQTVTTRMDECGGRGCRFRTRCFVNRARALAQLADLIVVNHALLFAEVGLDSPVLPPYRCVIFDEAHNIEDVATEALAVGVEGFALFRVTNFLYRKRRDGSGSGLLATAMHEASKMHGCGEGAGEARVVDLCSKAMALVDNVVESARQFFETIAEPFEELPFHVERVLLAECQPDLGKGSEAWAAAQRLREVVAALGKAIEELCEEFEGTREPEATLVELADDLRAQVAKLRELCEAAEFVLGQEEEAFVYWLQRVRRESGTYCSVHAAPLQIGDYIRTFFFDQKRTAIMTSATLQVDGQFDYMLERLGADVLTEGRIATRAFESPFDYDRQSLVGVTTFLPDPGGRRDALYDAELGSFLIDLLQCTRGRALVLFTSYSLLDAVYDAVKPSLERSGITVLAQGHSGSREAITNTFRTITSSVLLGTRSFWEGVDVSGEALSCLVLTKLPFHVFTDPLVRGRTDYLRSLGKDPFSHYTLPEAVINFRQGFGRLIRSRSDTGVVIVTDRRLVTKGYGRAFLNSLPTDHRALRKADQALEAVERFFAST